MTAVDLGQVGITRTWLVRPTGPITALATRGHGIGTGDVAQAPPLGAVADQIRDTLDGRVVVALRAEHQRGVLGAALPEWRAPRMVDLGRLAALAWPGTSQALGALEIQSRVAVSGPAGRAGHDAVATARVFLAVVRRLGWPAERVFRAADVTEPAAVAPMAAPAEWAGRAG